MAMEGSGELSTSRSAFSSVGEQDEREQPSVGRQQQQQPFQVQHGCHHHNHAQRPWQYDWKRPVWQRGDSSTPVSRSERDAGDESEEEYEDEDEDEYGPIDHTAASVLFQEVSEFAGPLEEQDPSSFVLTVTLLARRRRCELPDVTRSNGFSVLMEEDQSDSVPPAADVVLLELFRQRRRQPKAEGKDQDDKRKSSSSASSGVTKGNADVVDDDGDGPRGAVRLKRIGDRNATADEGPGQHLELLQSRRLRWPASALASSPPSDRGDSDSDEDDEDKGSDDSDDLRVVEERNATASRNPLSPLSFLSFCDPARAESAGKPPLLSFCDPSGSGGGRGGKKKKPKGLVTSPGRKHRRRRRRLPGPASTAAAGALVSACLCRLPPPDHVGAARKADAEDVLHLISLQQQQRVRCSHRRGGPSWSLSFSSSNNSLAVADERPRGNAVTEDNNDDRRTRDDDASSLTDLVLACLTNDGQIHFYSPFRLLLGGADGGARREEQKQHQPCHKKNQEEQSEFDDWEQSMAALILGDDLLSAVQDSILPLSEPLHSLELSVPLEKRQRGKTNLPWQNGTTDGKSRPFHSGSDRPMFPSQRGNRSGGGVSVWDFSLWDSTMDRATLRYRTVGNRVTVCRSALDYLCVAGRGRRRRYSDQGRGSNKQATAAAMTGAETVKATADANERERRRQQQQQQEEQAEEDTGENEANAHAEWWLQPEEKVGDEPGSPVLEKHEQEQEQKQKQDCNKTRDQQTASPPEWAPQGIAAKAAERECNGGFVTFISLYNYSQVRTVYLPFVPAQLQPFVWGKMSFLLVLGEKTKTSAAKIPAVAIRFDASEFTVQCGGPPSPFFPVVDGNGSSGEAAAATAVSSYDTTEHGLGTASAAPKPGNHQTTEIYVRRFQVLPIVLPQLPGGDRAYSRTTVVASSTFTSPPALVVAAATANDEPILVTQHTLHTIQLAPLSQVDPIFAHYPLTTAAAATGGGTCLHVIGTQHASGHVARVAARPSHGDSAAINRRRSRGHNRPDDIWSCVGQGWCVVGSRATEGAGGVADDVYFVCWEGATADRGAFWCELEPEAEPEQDDRGGRPQEAGGNSLRSPSTTLVTSILPLNPFVVGGAAVSWPQHQGALPGSRRHQQQQQREWRLPFAPQYAKHTASANAMRGSNGSIENLLSSLSEPAGKRDLTVLMSDQRVVDDVIVEAMGTISNSRYKETVADLSPPSSPRRRSSSFTHREKSTRLLSMCSSWTQLGHQPNLELRSQEPVVSVRLPAADGRLEQQFVLSLRRVLVAHGPGTPFQQVLSWLSEKRDYFTAASLALDLLRDADSLRHLWRAFEKIEDEDERSKLEGLLDGVVPIRYDDEEEDGQGRTSKILTQLADMTVGCLTKGGYAMSSTLEQFLVRDKRYDPSRASLMLVAKAASAVSDDEDAVASVMGGNYWAEDRRVDGAPLLDRILWPVRCLLKIGVARDSLETALLLMNATIPDELRRRRRGGVPMVSLPSMEMCKALVSLIVASSINAADMLLSLVDEQSRVTFWPSLQHDTRLELSLISIRGKSPMLREPEVRSWVLKELSQFLEATGSAAVAAANVPLASTVLPTPWLKTLALACLSNAGCKLDLLLESSESESPGPWDGETRGENHDLDDDADGLKGHKEEVQKARSALMPDSGSGGLDFDLLIPALLLLEQRKVLWWEGSSASTQSLLNSACYLAGRRISTEEPLFPMDGATLMRQCTLVGNVQAGANLVGGKNGLILECCDILMEYSGMGMEEAESFLVSEPMRVDAAEISKHDGVRDGPEPFLLHYGHRHVLWLLEEHVLRIRTYGDFETTNRRGRVDPCLAATVCFRTWWSLTRHPPEHLQEATAWLVEWLRKRLAIHSSGSMVSPQRLVCAALTRALVWPCCGREVKRESILGALLGMPTHFVLQLAQSCCGLVGALPNIEVERVWTTMVDGNHDSSGSVASAGNQQLHTRTGVTTSSDYMVHGSSPPRILQFDA